MVRIANVIIMQAIKDRASTIRIEADRRGVRVRCRIDGVLREVMVIPKYTHSPLVARFKVMARVNVAEHRLAQDGVIYIHYQNREYILPTHFMPSHFGELVEVHIRPAELISLEKLGLARNVLAKLQEPLTVSKGVVLFYTTDRMMLTQLLYGALVGNICVENSVLIVEEDQFIGLPGTEQIRVNPKAGLTLASILRQSQKYDIDVMMVSRIPDLETASKIFDFPARRVIAGMEVNDTAQAFYTLKGMGVDPYSVALRVTAVIGCRQVRKPCLKCREPREHDRERLEREGIRFAGNEQDPQITAFFGRGCADCRHTGYQGQTGVFEVILTNDELKDRLLKFSEMSPQDRKIALSQATVWSFGQDAGAKLLAGETTIDEAVRLLR
jgi:type IV pilus assembly protein PilB